MTVTEIMVRPDSARLADPEGPGPHPVHADDLVEQVRIRFRTSEGNALGEVQFWLDSLEHIEGRRVNHKDLSAWDVLYVLDSLADFEREDH